MKVKGEPAVYHLISRTALDGFVLGDVEKDHLVNIIMHLSAVYFAEVLGFCAMGNHFHLLVRMQPGDAFSDEEIGKRFKLYYGDDQRRELMAGQIPYFREKWSNLSEYIKEIKQGFSRFYNKLHDRKGYFWSDRFKSVIVDNGETLINCLAYIDLNPVRAGMVKKPEKYRWCSLGYHVQTNNKEGFLSLDLGLMEFGVKDERERLKYYRRFVYEKGALKGVKKERQKDFEIGRVDRFKYRTRYFSDSGVIGSKAYVERIYQAFKHHFTTKREKRPNVIEGLNGVYSLKRLSENR
jgi:REP element-mobilizing transposase RayT